MRRVLSLYVSLLAGGVALFAQDVSGAIGGTILDPFGAAVPNARLSIINTERNQVVRTLASDRSGTYSVPLISVGIYAIKVEASGFKTARRTGIVLNVNDDLTINITLQVGDAAQTIEVKEEEGVDLGSPASATTIEGTQIR